MITPMKKLEIYGINSSRKAVLESLQKLGCVEIINTDQEDKAYDCVDVSSSIMQFEKYLSQAEQAIKIIDEYSPEKKGLFSVRKTVSMDKYNMLSDEINTVGNKALEVTRLTKKIKENEMKIARENTLIASLESWLKLDIPINYQGTEEIKTSLYTAPFELLDKQAEELIQDKNIYCEIISASKDLTCMFLAYPKNEQEECEKLFRENGFVLYSASLSHRTPDDKIKNIKEKISKIEKDNKDIIEKIKSFKDERENIKLLSDHLSMRIEKYKSLEKVKNTEEAFVIEGYVPKNKCMKVKSTLETNALCAVEFFDIPDDEEAPILFENNGFAQPVEGITSTYSMPSRTDIDPNFIMAIFYYLFFGMMFSDAGYGLLMVIGAGYFAFFAKVEQSLKNTMKMFFFCGISTTFWGFMYGSFFGDAIYRISVTFFEKEIVLKPLWLDPVKEPLTLLIVSIAIGLVQILVGLIIKFYIDFKHGEKAAAVFDTGSWIIILLGVCFIALGMATKLSIINTVGIWMAIVGALMVVLMKDRQSKNPVKRLFSGILGLYDVTSYVSDALSYSRLMALGLATGVIAQVVNIMGTLSGSGVISAIVFALIFVAGHTLNFAINALGAYVHTNRLQYVEFYSKFYEGGGKAFSPLKINTKYFSFMEDKKKC